MARPFTCDGSPLNCRIFIVGLNSATQLGHPFFTRYWNDVHGFDRDTFERDYVSVRKKGGTRPRIESFVKGAFPVPCMETNIYAVPTKKASQLKSSDKNTDIIEYLIKTIRPAGIFVYTNEPIEFFQLLSSSKEICGDRPAVVDMYGQPTHVWGLPGPLWKRKNVDIENVGAKIKKFIAA